MHSCGKLRAQLYKAAVGPTSFCANLTAYRSLDEVAETVRAPRGAGLAAIEAVRPAELALDLERRGRGRLEPLKRESYRAGPKVGPASGR
jgi:hypothetical protein